MLSYVLTQWRTDRNGFKHPTLWKFDDLEDVLNKIRDQVGFNGMDQHDEFQITLSRNNGH